MIAYHEIDPVAFHLGPLAVRWYGISYLVGICIAWGLMHYRALKPNSGWTTQEVADLVFYVTVGLVIGGRLGHVLFYDLPVYMKDPLSMLKVWQGGMSFHGGLIGAALACAYHAWRYKKTFFMVTDYLCPSIPLALGSGRIGNFINGELWGKPTDLPWAMNFPYSGDNLPRHPSQLYEFSLEGVLLFIIVWIYSSKPRPTRAVSGLFLILYGIFRSLVEFVREPDANLGYLAFGWLTMGQVLCIPMLLLGAWMMISGYRRQAAKTA